MLRMILLCSLFSSLGADSATPCMRPEGAVARLPGDIMIGGLFPIHMGASRNVTPDQLGGFQCTGFDFVSAVQALSMIYAVEYINNSTLLQGITLGYEIYDTCSDVSKAMDGAMAILSTSDSSLNTRSTKICSEYEPVVKAVVGERYSEISASVSRLFSLSRIPQISYASSSSILNITRKYPSFLRTIPSDIYQMKAVAKLVSTFQWNWVGIIYCNDDYGRSAVESLLTNLDQQSVCIAFKVPMPYDLNDPDMSSTVDDIIMTLKNTSSAKAVFVISKAPLLTKLFGEIIKENITRTWIASTSWSASSQISSMTGISKIGTILGFSFRNGAIDGFKDFLQSLHPPSSGINTFLEEYKEIRFGCTDEYRKYKICMQTTGNNCNASDSVKTKSPLACSVGNVSSANDNFLVQKMHNCTSYSVNLAVTAIAQAIKRIACNNGSCTNINFTPYQLLTKLQDMEFAVPAGTFSFKDLGFINGYDLISWRLIDGLITFQTIGAYNVKGENITIIEHLLPWESKDKIPFSNCSRHCVPGEYKQYSTIRCCYECLPCTAGLYSPGIDLRKCTQCPNNQWSLNGSAKCEDREIQFFAWSNPFAIVLACFSSLGFLAVLLIGVIFLKHLNTPAVRAVGGIYSCVMGLSLLFSFLSTGFFIGQPTDTTCQIRQTMYGISFTLCVACILLKSLRILLAFELVKKGKSGMKITYQPALFIFLVTTIQVLICTMWLLLKPPSLVRNNSGLQVVLLQCTEGSFVAFGFMLGYTAVLAFVCFALAFKGRKLPEKYNEARLITFSMLIYLFVWLSFIPIYVTSVGYYFPAIQVVAILASSYGIICCHFLPACYIIFFKSRTNTREYYQKSIRNHHKAKTTVLSVSEYVDDPSQLFANAMACQIQLPLSLKHYDAVNCVRRKRHNSL